MGTRKQFAQLLAKLDLSHVERAIAFLYYYRETQEYEERTAASIAADLLEEGFPKPNATRLKAELAKSKFTVSGGQTGSFRIDVRKLGDLETRYASFMNLKRVEVYDSIVPQDWVKGTRTYIERMVYQINGTYESGFYDACAVLCRRLMESLIIEIYIHEKRHHEIQKGGVFLYLEALIKYITNDKSITLGRNVPKTLSDTKQIGDTAAHDRTYITAKVDLDDIKSRYRSMIQELLNKAAIVP